MKDNFLSPSKYSSQGYLSSFDDGWEMMQTVKSALINKSPLYKAFKTLYVNCKTEILLSPNSPLCIHDTHKPTYLNRVTFVKWTEEFCVV